MISHRLWLGACLGWGVAAGQLVAKDPPGPGATRTEVIAHYGPPSGTAHIGKREILTFPEGRAILENGLLKRFDRPAEMLSAAPIPATNTPSAAPAANAQPATSSASTSWWLTDINEARTRAMAQHKPILFLVTGDMSRCPWGVQFNESVHNSAEFIRKEAPDFVLLRLDLREISGVKQVDTKEEFDREVAKLENIVALRTAVIASDLIPAIAIVSPDLKQSTEVDMSGALPAMNDMLGYTLRSIDAAKSGPRKDISSVTASFASPTSSAADSSAPLPARTKLFFASLALVVFGVIARQFKK